MRNRFATERQAQQLSSIEHLTISAVAPSVKTIGFIPGGNFIIRNERRVQFFVKGLCFSEPREIQFISPLKKAAPVSQPTTVTVIFNSVQAMTRRTVTIIWISIDSSTSIAFASILFSRSN